MILLQLGLEARIEKKLNGGAQFNHLITPLEVYLSPNTGIFISLTCINGKIYSIFCFILLNVGCVEQSCLSIFATHGVLVCVQQYNNIKKTQHQHIVLSPSYKRPYVICFRTKSKAQIQLMGNLLRAKVYPSKLYLSTGLIFKILHMFIDHFTGKKIRKSSNYILSFTLLQVVLVSSCWVLSKLDEKLQYVKRILLRRYTDGRKISFNMKLRITHLYMIWYEEYKLQKKNPNKPQQLYFICCNLMPYNIKLKNTTIITFYISLFLVRIFNGVAL
ncbi:hypothetical protein AGLY_009217 [Aphis glycines]|uniref:Uncharacterized protein n=1 Tax=Aphis glycines TaxID=307491 RepID=A0A6G0TIM6_APHGL|nr:hypothetical protein AGLY_009217 [Aphis glycines]